ncbi:MAG: hypothetical protein ACXVEF_02850 [Polyangiales bacterium]
MKRLALAVLVCTTACGGTYVDKQTGLVTIQPGAKGGMVVTEHGMEFHDNADLPTRVVFKDVNEPWRAPLGFILPKTGRFTHTSSPTTIATPGLVVVLRPSDTRVPSWGGEILMRVDVHSPSSQATRAGERVAIVIDGDSDEMSAALETALGQLGGKDVVTVVDAYGARVLVPAIPATHRALALAASAARSFRPKPARDISLAVARGAKLLGKSGRILLLSSDEAKLSPPAFTFKRVDPKSETAAATIQSFIPPAGPVAIRDLELVFEGAPAPSRVIESTSGEPLWTLDGSELSFGDVRAGDARSDILRVSVPPWVSGKKFALSVTARFTDVASGKARVIPVTIASVFDEDLESIAESRNGDVIAYASALATLHRLHAAFVGSSIPQGGLFPLAKMQAQSLALLARDFPDRGFAEDAVVLQAILDASQ